MKKVVTLGGGTGHFAVLSALRQLENLQIKAVVSMADHGGSSGKLRDQLGVLPPGDLRQCLVALSHSPLILRRLFLYRFEKGDLKGHNFGNLFLSALEKITGSIQEAIKEASKVLNVSGEVIPASLRKTELIAFTKKGKRIVGEDKIDLYRNSRDQIAEVRLLPSVRINPRAKRAIERAELIIVSPGDLFGSILPVFLVKGFRKAFLNSEARKILMVNLVNKKGHTLNFGVCDYLEVLEKFTQREVFDLVVYNTKKPNRSLLERYKREGEIISPKVDCWRKKTIFLGENLLDSKKQAKFIRHDPNKLADFFRRIL